MHAFDHLIPNVIETIQELLFNKKENLKMSSQQMMLQVVRNSVKTLHTIKELKPLGLIFCNIKIKRNLQQATGKENIYGHRVIVPS